MSRKNQNRILRLLEKRINENLCKIKENFCLTAVYKETVGAEKVLVTKATYKGINIEHRMRLYGGLIVSKEQTKRINELAATVSRYLLDVASIKQAEQATE